MNEIPRSVFEICGLHVRELAEERGWLRWEVETLLNELEEESLFKGTVAEATPCMIDGWFAHLEDDLSIVREARADWLDLVAESLELAGVDPGAFRMAPCPECGAYRGAHCAAE